MKLSLLLTFCLELLTIALVVALSGCGADDEPNAVAVDAGVASDSRTAPLTWSPACDTIDGDPHPQQWVAEHVGCNACILVECPGFGPAPILYTICSTCSAHDGGALTSSCPPDPIDPDAGAAP